MLAIGNPLGEDLTFTVTQGIVSAKGRAQLDLGDNDGGKLIQDYIQTDAVINRGNSGGPLVNARGEVIGINAAIASTTGYYTGYAFAVPIDLARKVMDQIVSQRPRGARRPGHHGHGCQPRRRRVSRPGHDRRRARVDELPLATIRRPRRPASKPGDVIVAIDGQPMKYTSQLQQIVGFRHPGESVKVDVVRKDGKHTLYRQADEHRRSRPTWPTRRRRSPRPRKTRSSVSKNAARPRDRAAHRGHRKRSRTARQRRAACWCAA